MNGAGSSGPAATPTEASGQAPRRPILVAALGLVLLLAGTVLYFYGDALIERAQSLLIGSAIHAQGHIRY